MFHNLTESAIVLRLKKKLPVIEKFVKHLEDLLKNKITPLYFIISLPTHYIAGYIVIVLLNKFGYGQHAHVQWVLKWLQTRVEFICSDVF